MTFYLKLKYLYISVYKTRGTVASIRFFIGAFTFKLL